MKTFFLLIFCFFIFGCVTTPQTPVPLAGSGQKSTLTKIDHVQAGMSEAQVMAVMGSRLRIGYQETEPDSGMMEDISIASPYKTEDLKMNGKDYRVDYFYTRVKHADNTITDDELTPLVFRNDKLVGQGEDFLFNLRRQAK